MMPSLMGLTGRSDQRLDLEAVPVVVDWRHLLFDRLLPSLQFPVSYWHYSSGMVAVVGGGLAVRFVGACQ